jgi:hypothetical protein
MFEDEFERPALQEVWPILAALAALFILTAAILYPLLGKGLPLARRLAEGWRGGDLKDEERGAAPGE